MFDPMCLADLRPAEKLRTRRSSSYDRSGANADFRRIPAGESLEIFSAEGPGVIRRIWFALAHVDYNYLRSMVLRAWWDDAETPSVNCPLGDFFGVGHAAAYQYQSAVMNMVRGTGGRGETTGMNCYLPMPFSRGARIEVCNESPVSCYACYYQVDWLEGETDGGDLGRLHALWRRENPRVPAPQEQKSYLAGSRLGLNLDGEGNYLVADVRGRGRLAGMNLSLDNVTPTVFDSRTQQAFNEGDEMIFLDDEPAPASLHGTGTEDYFTDAWGMTGEAGLYAGSSLPASGPAESQRGTCYRFHLLDPVYFRRSMRFTFELGINNCHEIDAASTCYWYQDEPVGCELPPAAARRPRRLPGEPEFDEEDRAVRALAEPVDAWYDACEAAGAEMLDALAADPRASRALEETMRLRQEFLRGGLTAEQVRLGCEPYLDAIRRIAGGGA
jgi:hypothetical protein